jgi:C-5 cytosine-specific DNA methylase
MKAYDLYCGLGGWAEGFLAEGYEVVGFDIEAHDYGTGGYPGTLILRDVRSINGADLADATVIVGSSPCQEFSYRAMPWKRAKALPPPYLGIELFNHQFRIQREACEAAGHYIPLVVENVCGAQKWVGAAPAHYGSFYLWGDVGMVGKRIVAGSPRFGQYVEPGPRSVMKEGVAHRSNREQSLPDSQLQSVLLSRLPDTWGLKEGGDWWDKECRKTGMAQFGSKSLKRKAASAMIAKIPFPLAVHVARCFKPA